MTNPTLEQLAARCLGDNLDTLLDEAIARAVGFKQLGDDYGSCAGHWVSPADWEAKQCWDGWGSGRDAPEFSTCLSAAVSLKRPGDLWCVGSMKEGPFARVVPAIAGGRFGEEIAVYAANEAAALSAAFLYARARAAS